jgi:hypothetical protein
MTLINALLWLTGPGAGIAAYALIEALKPRWNWLYMLDAEDKRWFAAALSTGLAIAAWAVICAGTDAWPQGNWFVWASAIFSVAFASFGVSTLAQARHLRGTTRVPLAAFDYRPTGRSDDAPEM